MIEIEKDGKKVFKGTKSECIQFLKENGVTIYEKNIFLLRLATIATREGFDMFIRE